MRILFVEDEETVSRFVTQGLTLSDSVHAMSRNGKTASILKFPF